MKSPHTCVGRFPRNSGIMTVTVRECAQVPEGSRSTKWVDPYENGVAVYGLEVSTGVEEELKST